MRHRQSSVITDTQYPVRSIGAAAFAGGGGAAGVVPRPCAASETNSMAARPIARPAPELRRMCLRVPAFTALLASQALVHSLDELVGRPRARVGAVARAIPLHRIRLTDLRQRHPLLHQILD